MYVYTYIIISNVILKKYEKLLNKITTWCHQISFK